MLEYPYKRIQGSSFPLIPVTLSIPKGITLPPLLALPDSGAIISLFQADIAQLLGLDLTAGDEIDLVGIKDGLKAYVHLVQCKVGWYACNCRIAFSAELTTDFQILGRLDFFEKCTVLFDETDQKLYLTPRVT